ncbi:MAG: anaerobic ribonucleoside-triphosphate reductase activating protein [Ruminococcus bicirculans]|jgi:anaerobic ribonucleoside-triphosphate reductase activating protein|uniref:anaerobic ribonucleoside-triphosphate reductase activating protein n=1 Tax=Ruminococcus TaxID=1263 RepID=UPI00242CF33C|nr:MULTISPECIES: anaerobic ribonucleoside-triphosphate reductase activating protein [Ruminococcus]MBS6818391.1 anaerobic ribonucleoside-triphosphate reductase activating protein [Ruminococcus bicirculans (ex Wegman et al. 2014)]MEE0470257.1 anaerobic ribonucleoside-triphosphate reductase activating protein [Ruminococcus sp.]
MNYHNITKDDMLNGDGLRTVLWVSGCNHHCKNCQNPQTWNRDSGIPFDFDTIFEICNQLDKSYISGITFSGGDPLFPDNREIVCTISALIKDCYPTKTQWIYTGYKWEEIKDLPIMECIDVVVDGQYEDDKRDITLKWRGSSNQRVIDVQESLKQNKVILWCD